MYGKILIVLFAVFAVAAAPPPPQLKISCEKCKVLAGYANKFYAAIQPYHEEIRKVCERNVSPYVPEYASMPLCDQYLNTTFKYYFVEGDADIRCHMAGLCPKPTMVQDESPEFDTCDECVKAISQANDFVVKKIDSFAEHNDLVCGLVDKLANRPICKNFVKNFAEEFKRQMAEKNPKAACAAIKLCKRY